MDNFQSVRKPAFQALDVSLDVDTAIGRARPGGIHDDVPVRAAPAHQTNRGNIQCSIHHNEGVAVTQLIPRTEHLEDTVVLLSPAILRNVVSVTIKPPQIGYDIALSYPAICEKGGRKTG